MCFIIRNTLREHQDGLLGFVGNMIAEPEMTRSDQTVKTSFCRPPELNSADVQTLLTAAATTTKPGRLLLPFGH